MNTQMIRSLLLIAISAAALLSAGCGSDLVAPYVNDDDQSDGGSDLSGDRTPTRQIPRQDFEDAEKLQRPVASVLLPYDADLSTLELQSELGISREASSKTQGLVVNISLYPFEDMWVTSR